MKLLPNSKVAQRMISYALIFGGASALFSALGTVLPSVLFYALAGSALAFIGAVSFALNAIYVEKQITSSPKSSEP